MQQNILVSDYFGYFKCPQKISSRLIEERISANTVYDVVHLDTSYFKVESAHLFVPVLVVQLKRVVDQRLLLIHASPILQHFTCDQRKAYMLHIYTVKDINTDKQIFCHKDIPVVIHKNPHWRRLYERILCRYQHQIDKKVGVPIIL